MTDEAQIDAETAFEPAAVAQDEPAADPAPETAAEPKAAPEAPAEAPEPVEAEDEVEVAAVTDEPEVAAVTDEVEDEPEAMRTDGPTLKEWVEAGYAAEAYPPTGYEPVSAPAPDPINLNALRGVQNGPPPHPRTG
jgi:hypothetical protein